MRKANCVLNLPKMCTRALDPFAGKNNLMLSVNNCMTVRSKRELSGAVYNFPVNRHGYKMGVMD